MAEKLENVLHEFAQMQVVEVSAVVTLLGKLRFPAGP